MLTQFDEASGTALGGNELLSRSHMRGDGATPRNPAIQLRAASPRQGPAVASSRSEGNDDASFLSACHAALIDIAAVASAVLFVCATGIGVAFIAFVLFFVPL